jgi:hypothetical protein
LLNRTIGSLRRTVGWEQLIQVRGTGWRSGHACAVFGMSIDT